jgi:rhomboid protease GluP
MRTTDPHDQPHDQSYGAPQDAPQFSLQRPVAVYVLLAAIILVFIAQLVGQQQNYPRLDPLTIAGVSNFNLILFGGEYYRLLTAMFLHADTTHIFFNGLILYQFGRSIESFYGTPRFLLVYFLGGLLGSIASFMLTQGSSLGASGAIFALVGAEMVFLLKNRDVLHPDYVRTNLQSLLLMAGINFGIGFLSEGMGGRIDNWGHIGGLIGGLALSWLIAPKLALQAGTRRIVDTVSRSTIAFSSALYTVTIFGILAFFIFSNR